uniref:Uncharacterized protein n=1 Tax=Planktothricoides sp. SpSt-374 TaxID=2282167 RepID=A0A7C3ZZL3_9CYAN
MKGVVLLAVKARSQFLGVDFGFLSELGFLHVTVLGEGAFPLDLGDLPRKGLHLGGETVDRALLLCGLGFESFDVAILDFDLFVGGF